MYDVSILFFLITFLHILMHCFSEKMKTKNDFFNFLLSCNSGYNE